MSNDFRQEPPRSTFNYGDGNDGAGSYSGGGTSTLSRVMFFSSLNISNSTTLDTNGFPIFVSGTLSIASGSKISSNGGNASLDTAGIQPINSTAIGFWYTTLPGPSGGNTNAGQPGSNINSVSAGQASLQPIGLGGPGGAGGDGSGGRTGGAAPTIATPLFAPRTLALAGTFIGLCSGDSSTNASTWAYAGGTGGSGGGGDGVNKGGGGGGSGGIVWIFARTISNLGTIEAKGGSGGNGGVAGNCGGGGGGGGGAIIIVTGSNSYGSTSVAGGAGGTKTGTGTNGSSGSSGNVYAFAGV